MIGYSKLDQVGPEKKSQTDKNKDANAELDKVYTQKGIDSCEAHLDKYCLPKEKKSNGGLLKHTYAHRHKRNWYKGKPPELLYSFNQTLRVCLPCHMSLEVKPKVQEQLFITLRGKEK